MIARTALFFAALILTSASWAQTPQLTTPLRLRAAGLSEYANWGRSVALGRDFALVAAPRDTIGPPLFLPPRNRNGSVTVFERAGSAWTETARLVGRSGTGSDEDFQEFGFSVAALDLAGGGRVAVVGSPLWNANTEDGPYTERRHVGRAYVFRQDPATGRWAEEATLRADETRAFENVGTGVAVTETKFGLVAVAGAPGYYRPNGPAGRAYVHARDPSTGEWTREAALDGCLPRGTDAQYRLGSLGEDVSATSTGTRTVVAMVGSATINGETVSAGCIFSRDDTGSSPGTWTLDETAASSPVFLGSRSTVSVSAASDAAGGSVVAVGFAEESRVFVYERLADESAWARVAELRGGPDAYTLGKSSDLVWTLGGYVLLVGADFDQTFGPNNGAAHLFRRSVGVSAWEPTALLGPPGGLAYLNLGESVAVGVGGWVSASASFQQVDDGEGRAYLYDVSSLFPVFVEAPIEVRTSRLSLVGANPARSSAAFAFSLDAPSSARLVVVDALGRTVAVLADRDYGAGSHVERLDVSGLPAGVYIARLTTGGRAETRTFTVVQ